MSSAQFGILLFAQKITTFVCKFYALLLHQKDASCTRAHTGAGGAKESLLYIYTRGIYIIH